MKKRHKIIWTSEMIILLKKYANNPLKSRDDLSKILKISSGAIRNQERLLNIEWIQKKMIGQLNPMFGKLRPDFKKHHWTKVGYKQNGVKNPNWKGGTFENNGYIYLLISENKYKAMHRIIVEEYLGRKLLKDEIIHHINGDTLDNRIENLQLCSGQSEHLSIHWKNGTIRGNVQ